MTCVSCVSCVPCLLRICGHKSQHVQELLRFVYMPVASCAAQALDRWVCQTLAAKTLPMSLVYHHYRPLKLSLGNQTTEALKLRFRGGSVVVRAGPKDACELTFRSTMNLICKEWMCLRFVVPVLFPGRVACYCMLNETSQCINIKKLDSSLDSCFHCKPHQKHPKTAENMWARQNWMV